MFEWRKRAVELHERHRGKISTALNVRVNNETDLSLAYSPGVAEPAKLIQADKNKAYDYTIKGNTVAVVTDGSAVLGLGNIGPEAALPVMEGKSLLFKSFANIDSFPICLNTTDVEEIIQTVKMIAPTFGGINLEDISAPRCFEIEKRLKEELSIPVFHDDQHGTAIVIAASLINSLAIVDKHVSQIKVVVNGAGAAGIATIKMLLQLGVENIVVCDSQGAIYREDEADRSDLKAEIAEQTNPHNERGLLQKVIKDADVFIGVSIANVLSPYMVRSMAKDPIIFAMANPSPEINPEDAREAGAKIVGTGRSDYPNQINNLLAFPGVFRGALAVRATDINDAMKLAAAEAIAHIVSDEELTSEYVIPSAFHPLVVPTVARAVAKAAIDSRVATIHVNPEEVYAQVKEQIESSNR